MKSLANCLTAAGQLTNDQDVIMSVLNGLGLEYDPIVMLITSREDFISLNEAQYLLMAQEHRLELATSAASLDLTNAAANFATSNQRFQGGRGNNNRGGRGRGQDSNWYFDSGATNHMTSEVSNLTHKQDYKCKDKVAQLLLSVIPAKLTN
ncbi:hypothetical protein ACOSQ2_032114 [Xanthoceras sorbifolium]